jgi:hypothetical protein
MFRTSLLLVAPALLAATACGYGDHTGHGYYDGGYGSAACGEPARRGVIDTDATLDVEPATGVGVFVEYASGGHWHVFVGCDSEQSGYECAFDVIVQPIGQSKVTNVAPEGLESEDTVSIVGADAVELVSRTDFDFDGFTLDTDPGVALSVDAFLDNDCTNFVYWVGDGAVHDGAPSSPVEFEPSAE